MLRTLLTTTALAALLSTGAMAQDATATPAATAAPTSLLATGLTNTDSDNLATNIIGKQVYSSTAADAEHIGDVNNLVLNQDGSVAAVIIGVGGFLGIGEKNVAVNYSELQWTTAADNTERFVLPTTKDALNAAPAFEWTDDQPAGNAAMTAPATTSTDTTTTAMAPATDTTTTAMPANTVDTTGFTDVQLTADELKGTTAYGPNNENLGTIGDVVLADDGKTVDAVIIDFGGFLGIGTKPVAVGFDSLKFQRDPNNNRFVYVNVTRDQLDKAVAFDKNTYKTDATQRMVVNG